MYRYEIEKLQQATESDMWFQVPDDTVKAFVCFLGSLFWDSYSKLYVLATLALQQFGISQIRNQLRKMEIVSISWQLSANIQWWMFYKMALNTNVYKFWEWKWKYDQLPFQRLPDIFDLRSITFKHIYEAAKGY